MLLVKDVNLSVDEVTLAQALAALKSAKVQEKGDVIKELSVPVSAASTKVSTVIPTTAATTITAVSSRARAKGIVFHEQEKGYIICTILEKEENTMQQKSRRKGNRLTKQKKLSKGVSYMDTELVKESSKKAKAEIAQESSSKRAGEALEQESSKKKKVDNDKETKELKQCMEIIPDDGDDVIKSSWSLVKFRRRYIVSSLMDTAYELSDQQILDFFV
ncbi:hypothetical protein Tco_0218872 [Tanacetum coccineum]